MLRDALSATGIAPTTAASLLGIDPTIFQEWIAEQRPVPHSFASLLSTIIGTDLTEPVIRKSADKDEEAEVTPAIWYRLREPELVNEDREYVFLIRQLGHYIHDLEEVTGTKLVGWKTLFSEIRNSVDKQAPPRVQGRQAASMFRDNRGLSHGAEGIGDLIRGNLRSMGIVVIETPIPESLLEGCCFLVGAKQSERPCVFANSHHSTWFRRNFVIMHEVAHAIFDAEAAGAALDFKNQPDDKKIAEERADAFAQELLVPSRVLSHVAQKAGIAWDGLDDGRMAVLVANVQVEQKSVLKAAWNAGLISSHQYDEYMKLDPSKALKGLTDRALSTSEYIRKYGGQEVEWIGKRNTTIPSKRLRLPVLYVAKVVEAFQNFQISRGKAAEMLMIDEDTFLERFGHLAEALEDE